MRAIPTTDASLDTLNISLLESSCSFEYKCTTEGHIEYRIPNGALVNIHWG